VLGAVGVGELLFSKYNRVFRVEMRSSAVGEEEGLDAVLEEVVEAKGAVVEAVAESGSRLFCEPVLVCCAVVDDIRIYFGNSISTAKANPRSVRGQE